MEYLVLGPIEALDNGRPLLLRRRAQRLILGILALRANHLVPAEHLIDYLWGESPPQRARAIVHSRISELRAILKATKGPEEPPELQTRDQGYMLHTAPHRVDAHRFRHLVETHRQTHNDEEARSTLRQALGLWRGPALGGGLGKGGYNTLCQALESARLTATEELLDLELRLDNHQGVVDELCTLSDSYPTRERLIELMMLALHRCGRTTEALRAYERWRRWLGHELGTDPGPRLRELHLHLLRGNVAARTNTSTADNAASIVDEVMVNPTTHTGTFHATQTRWYAHRTAPIPRTLPPDIVDFTGRASEIAALNALLASTTNGRARTAALAGPAGTGKSTLCVHIAHTLASHYPDGQLFTTLRDQDNRPVSPTRVLKTFLRILGVADHDFPLELDEQVALYRTLMGSRRILVVLDNGVNDEQILPLIPGSPTCGVLLNGRVPLGRTFGVPVTVMERLSTDQAISFLARMAGRSKVYSDPESAVIVARLCGHLPLALRIVGARLSAKPHWSMRTLVHLLSDERTRLDHLTYGHLNVRASIRLSLRDLSRDAQLLVRRLGCLRSAPTTAPDVATFLGVTMVIAEALLEQLLDANLVNVINTDPAGHAGFRLRELVRLVAKEQAA